MVLSPRLLGNVVCVFLILSCYENFSIYLFLSYLVECDMFVTETFLVVRVRSCIDDNSSVVAWMLVLNL